MSRNCCWIFIFRPHGMKVHNKTQICWQFLVHVVKMGWNTTKDLAYKLLYFTHGAKHFCPGFRLKIRWLDRNYVSIQLPISQSLLFRPSWNFSVVTISKFFSRIESQSQNILQIEFSWSHTNELYMKDDYLTGSDGLTFQWSFVIGKWTGKCNIDL